MYERLIWGWLALCLVGQLYVIPVWLRHKPFLTAKWRFLHSLIVLMLAHMALTSGWLIALLFLLAYTALFSLQILFFLPVSDEEEESLWSVVAASLLMAGEILFWPAMAILLPTSEEILNEWEAMNQGEKAQDQKIGEDKDATDGRPTPPGQESNRQ